MKFSSAVIALSAFSASALAKYAPFPLRDGFPSPNQHQLKDIQRRAGGSLPNGPLPSKLTPGAAVTFQLIAANEIFEVAYFDQLLHNLTHNVPGYHLHGEEREYAIKAITAVKAQEELHAIGANAILANAHQEPIKPCAYRFPVSNYKDAIALAATFTDVVLSVLPLAQTTFAQDGGQEFGLIQLVGSIIAQEGEQDGWYRYVQGKNPSAAPFLTTTNPSFAFTALKSFIVPGSCPNIGNIEKNIPTFGALNIISRPKAHDSSIYYSVKGHFNPKKANIVYLTGQLEPVVVPIGHVYQKHGYTFFEAPFPFGSDGFSRGLTVAALTQGICEHPTAAQVAAATLYGPGLIEL